MTPRPILALYVAALSTVAPACALTSKSVPVELHYFTPEALDVPHTTAGAKSYEGQGAAHLRLGRVTSSTHLRTKIVYRHAPHELGAYDQERWTEAPEAYVRRALERALFEEERFARGYAGPTPALDVELVAFEEVRRGGALSGRVEIAYVLHDDRDVIASGRVAVERPSSSHAMGDVVAAIGAALDGAIAQIAARVERRMAVPGRVE